MSLTFEERIEAEVAPLTCTTCLASLELTDAQWEKFKVVRARLPKAAVARILDVSESAYKRHVKASHVDLR